MMVAKSKAVYLQCEEMASDAAHDLLCVRRFLYTRHPFNSIQHIDNLP